MRSCESFNAGGVATVVPTPIGAPPEPPRRACLSISINLSIYPSICLIIYISISAPVKASMLEGLQQSFPLLSVRCWSLHVLPASIYIPIYLFICLSIYIHIYLYTHLPTYISISAPVKASMLEGLQQSLPLQG